MPLAVTHVILTIICIDFYRDYVTKHKKYFTMWTLFVGGLAGLAPDLDTLISYILSYFSISIPLLSHGEITHTPFIGLIFLIPFGIFWMMKKHKLAVIFLAISFGILFHIFLDFVLGGGDIQGLMLLYPFSTQMFQGLMLISDANAVSRAGLDAIILILWLFHEERKHKILDFI
ncbi:MAG: metal-dependent hydrolase [Candidatus Aenigmatarchaeota archaeon]